MKKGKYITGLILSLLGAFCTIGLLIYSINYWNNTNLNFWEMRYLNGDGILKDAMVEGIFSGIIIVLAIVSLIILFVSKSTIAKRVFVIILGVINLWPIRYYLFSFLNLKEYLGNSTLIDVITYSAVAMSVIFIVAEIFLILTLNDIAKYEKIKKDEERKKLYQSFNLDTKNIENDVNCVYSEKNEQSLIDNREMQYDVEDKNLVETSANVESLSTLFGLGNTKEENINQVQVNGEEKERTLTEEERREKLRNQIGEEKIKYAQKKAREYKAKFESGEINQSEFNALMKALKEELLKK